MSEPIFQSFFCVSLFCSNVLFKCVCYMQLKPFQKIQIFCCTSAHFFPFLYPHSWNFNFFFYFVFFLYQPIVICTYDDDIFFFRGTLSLLCVSYQYCSDGKLVENIEKKEERNRDSNIKKMFIKNSPTQRLFTYI